MAPNPSDFVPIVSASRRTDLVAFYPDYLAEQLQALPVSSIAFLCTRQPKAIYDHRELKLALQRHFPFVHVTVTGMGGTEIEPHAPTTAKGLEAVARLVEHLGNPDQVRVRFDPIVHRLTDGWSNLEFFPAIAQRCRELGIRRVHFSFAQFNAAFYPQVVENLQAAGVRLMSPAKERKMADLKLMLAIAEGNGLSLHSCVSNTYGLITPSACVDGPFLQGLFGLPVDLTKDPTQRRKCNCVVSQDLGRYSHPCHHLCAYCYARGRNGARKRRWEKG